MKVKDYFERLLNYDRVTFIKARARKDANTPFYHAEYQTTPINTVYEWRSSTIVDYIILNDKQPSIDWLCGCSWRGVKCMLVISEEDLKLLYPSAEQRQGMVEYIDKQITTRKQGWEE